MRATTLFHFLDVLNHIFTLSYYWHRVQHWESSTFTAFPLSSGRTFGTIWTRRPKYRSTTHTSNIYHRFRLSRLPNLFFLNWNFRMSCLMFFHKKSPTRARTGHEPSCSQTVRTRLKKYLAQIRLKLNKPNMSLGLIGSTSSRTAWAYVFCKWIHLELEVYMNGNTWEYFNFHVSPSATHFLHFLYLSKHHLL